MDRLILFCDDLPLITVSEGPFGYPTCLLGLVLAVSFASSFFDSGFFRKLGSSRFIGSSGG